MDRSGLPLQGISHFNARFVSPLGTSVTLWGPLGMVFKSGMRSPHHGCRWDWTNPHAIARNRSVRDPKVRTIDRANGWSQQVTLIYGARRKSLLAGMEDFRQAGFNTELCTDDGSEGQKKLVPEVLRESFPPFQAIQRCGW